MIFTTLLECSVTIYPHNTTHEKLFIIYSYRYDIFGVLEFAVRNPIYHSPTGPLSGIFEPYLLLFFLIFLKIQKIMVRPSQRFNFKDFRPGKLSGSNRKKKSLLNITLLGDTSG